MPAPRPPAELTGQERRETRDAAIRFGRQRMLDALNGRQYTERSRGGNNVVQAIVKAGCRVNRGLGLTWLEPTLLVELTYSEMIEERLRKSVYRGVATV